MLLLVAADGDFDVDSGFDVDGGDVLDDGGRGVHVDQPLVNAHLETVEGLGTLTARALAGSDAKKLGRKTHRALDVELLVLGTLDELATDLLEGLDVARTQSNADLVQTLLLRLDLLAFNLRHFS